MGQGGGERGVRILALDFMLIRWARISRMQDRRKSIVLTPSWWAVDQLTSLPPSFPSLPFSLLETPFDVSFSGTTRFLLRLLILLQGGKVDSQHNNTTRALLWLFTFMSIPSPTDRPTDYVRSIWTFLSFFFLLGRDEMGKHFSFFTTKNWFLCIINGHERKRFPFVYSSICA